MDRLLEDGEHVEAAAVIFTGPRAGMEALLAPLLRAAAWLVMQGRRRFFTVAATNRGVVLLRNVGASKPAEVLWRSDGYGKLGPINDATGDLWVEVDGDRYWTAGTWSTELYRMRKVIAPGSRAPGTAE